MYQFEWDQHQQYQAQLISVCYQERQRNSTSGVATTIKHNLYESDFDFFKINDAAVAALLEWCRQSVFEAAQHANKGRWPTGSRIGIDVHESWCHVTAKGGYHDIHIHPNSSWSGIYYIKAGSSNAENRDGVNRFYSPLVPAYSDIGTRWVGGPTSIDVVPRDGQLVVFPSWLPHSATPYHGDQDRIVIAFNTKFIDGTNNVSIDI